MECPSHVARSPVRGFFSHEAVGFIDGSGAVGTRRLPSNRNALNVGAATFGFSRRGSSGCMLRNASPAHNGEALIRSRRNPPGLLPIDFMNNRVLGLVHPYASASALSCEARLAGRTLFA